MKDDRVQILVSDECFELTVNLTCFVRAAICRSDHQIEILIFTSEIGFSFVLPGFGFCIREHSPLAFLVLGALNGQSRICAAQIIPSERLIECIANKGVDFFNHTGRDKFTFIR